MTAFKPLPSSSQNPVTNHTHPHSSAEADHFSYDGHESLDEISPTHLHSAGAVHPHVHDPESLRRIINRLARIEGHIRGIKTMVQESRPCPDVLVQVAAVRGALDRVARIILDEHLSECVSRAAEEGNIDDEIRQLKAALDRFLP
ncbi:MAG TPA: metal-sensitive transcriptional regulator [Leptolyngbyaceae cyanobacterium]